MKRLINLMVLSVFFGTQILAINVGFKLSLYRILFLTITTLFTVMLLNNDERIRIYPRKLSSTYTLFFGCWVVYSLLSIIWAQSVTGWIKANMFIGIGVVSITFIQLFIKEKEDLMTIFKIIVLGISVHVVLGLSELLTGKYIWASEHFMTKYQPGSKGFFTRIPTSIYPNQNDYATIILMGTFFIIILFKNTKNVIKKMFYAVLWLVSVFLMNQTDSRANTLALILGLVAMFIVYLLPLLTRKIFVVFSSVLGATSLLLVSMSSTARSQITDILQMFNPYHEFGGTSNEMRVNLIRNGFVFLRDSFGLGVGAGNIEFLMKNDAPYQTGGISNMHNWWMEILTAYGIGIFILYIAMYVSLIRQAYMYYRRSSDTFIRQTSLAIVGFLTAFTLSSISSASNIINEWQWLIFGVIIAFYAYCERQVEKQPLHITY